MHNAARLAGIRRMLVKCDHVVAAGCPCVDQSAAPSVLLHTKNLPIEVERLFCVSNGEVYMRQSISPYHGSLPLQHVRVYPAGEKPVRGFWPKPQRPRYPSKTIYETGCSVSGL